jgi:hypothetical protein
MTIDINPCYDFPFKKIFGSPENSICLVSLLNAVLNLPKKIISVTIENPFNQKDIEED